MYRLPIATLAAACLWAQLGTAADLTVDLGNARGIASVAAFHRWDMDGNPRREVNPKAKIEAPEVDATATDAGGGRWVFNHLPPGKYDLVIMGPGRVRLEGWEYAPVLEFDPFFAPDTTLADETRELITRDIAGARHYENKVVPLYMGGTEKVLRILVMLIRDQPTSYEAEMAGAATIRFEIWQYEWRYGGWVKQKRTRVIHRVILPRDELRQWTWLWVPELGAVEVSDQPKTLKFDVSKTSTPALRGLRPY
jgi:hypothetical protein